MTNHWSCQPAEPALELMAADGRNFANWTLVDELYHDRTESVWRKRMEPPRERGVTERTLDQATRSDYMALCGELMHAIAAFDYQAEINIGSEGTQVEVRDGDLWHIDVCEDETDGEIGLLGHLTAAVVAVRGQ